MGQLTPKTIKGKRGSTENKIRILRQADAGQSIGEVCCEHNLSEVSFYRWKKQFGQMEVNEAKKLKDLERERGELKKMLAESLLEIRVLKFVCEKKLNDWHHQRVDRVGDEQHHHIAWVRNRKCGIRQGACCWGERIQVEIKWLKVEIKRLSPPSIVSRGDDRVPRGVDDEAWWSRACKGS